MEERNSIKGMRKGEEQARACLLALLSFIFGVGLSLPPSLPPSLPTCGTLSATKPRRQASSPVITSPVSRRRLAVWKGTRRGRKKVPPMPWCGKAKEGRRGSWGGREGGGEGWVL